MLVELNFTPLTLPFVSNQIGTLFDKIAYGAYQAVLNVDSVALMEALAEKLISFPRRLALYVKRNPAPDFLEGSGWDQSLVRHLYDVWIMLTHSPDLVADKHILREVVQKVIDKDGTDFERQHPEFLESPRAILLNSIAYAVDCQALREQYARFLGDMVYAEKENRPTYKAACEQFSAVLSEALVEVGT